MNNVLGQPPAIDNDRGSARRRQLTALQEQFRVLYSSGRLQEAAREALHAIESLYDEDLGFHDLIVHPSDDLRPAFRIEHDACEVLRTFVAMIEGGPRGGGGVQQPVPAQLDFLRLLTAEFPDSRFALNLRALVLLEHGHAREAFEVARASFSVKKHCPFGESVLQKTLTRLRTEGDLPHEGLSNIERAIAFDVRDYVCTKPFTDFSIWRTGEVYVCCGAWLPISIGNVFHQSVEEIWNSPAAREIRRSMIEGDFRYCSRSCAFINNRLLMKRSDLLAGRCDPYDELWGIFVYKRAAELVPWVADHLAHGRTRVAGGPPFVNLAYDYTCNLHCRSCRRELRAADPTHHEQLDWLRESFILPLLPEVRELLVAGDGDPFASRHYRSILASVDRTTHPNLHLSILTNGLLFTENEWKRYRNLHGVVHNVSVSIDAATAETYETLRCGGNWERLIQNLEFLASLHRAGTLPGLELNYVVQERNFREMKAFVRLGHRLGVDRVRFVQLSNDFEAFSQEEFMGANVFSPTHPAYSELIETLRDDIFQDKMVIYPRLEIEPDPSAG